jgi:ribosome biogenesis GTPase / thiamine phosphate phosphatase
LQPLISLKKQRSDILPLYKKPISELSQNIKTGQVYRATGSHYSVKDEGGVFWNCRLKGKLKLDNEISSTNPIVVGDFVSFEVEVVEKLTGTITEIAERRNHIVRVSPRNEYQQHIIASNLDLAIIIASISTPRTSLGFIDRFLITAEAYHIPALIVMNKTDLLNKNGYRQLENMQVQYKKAGYEILPVTATDKATLLPLEAIICGKTALISGHSGVGKSTLIKNLIPGIQIKTNKLSNWSGKGQHTTTFSEMFDLPAGGVVMDTPGIKEFGLIDVSKEELGHFFPEIKRYMTDCKFNNCMHFNEPGCAVKAAVAEDKMGEDRYLSYLGILESLEKKW